ncbi:hypothetical protein LIER_06695 [Lithospermum erythrorhizon]|uniref:C2H2-type domain-containing protein n=1 Tax=Lithospermum erythrorhizon TaxID=34254 RepID=A0AAV3P6V6_LITER
MPGLTCNACNKEFDDEIQQKLHFKSEWHRYNLKRKVAGVTETLFIGRQSQEKNKPLEGRIKNASLDPSNCIMCDLQHKTIEACMVHMHKPRPTAANDLVVSSILASRYKSMGLATVQSKEHLVKMKVLKAMSRSGVETMHSKIGMKSNAIRNLPNNVPY